MAARKFERNDFDDEQKDALASNTIDAKTIADIQDIRKDIFEEMNRAKMDGILHEKDAQELEREIQKNSADKQGMIQAANKVKAVIDENKGLLDTFVKGLTTERDIDNKLIIDDHIGRFKALSTEEKKTYVKNLRKNLDWVETLYKEVLKHAPDKISDFRSMTGKEKKSFVEELQSRGKNIDQYRKLIESHREHFSKESAEEYMTQFKDLNQVEQKRWISDFSKEVERKAEVTNKFKAFPKELQAKFPDFFDARKNQRLVILQNMERELEVAHLDVLNNDPNAQHFSEKDRAEAMKWWKQASTDIRILMLENLPAHLRKTAELSKKYEAMSDGVKLDVQQKLGFSSFYDLNFNEKTKAIEEAKRLDESGDRLTAQYEGKLQDALGKKYMAKVTYDAFMKEFKELSINEKTDWMNNLETKELNKRREVTERFQKELPEDAQKKNDEFYQMAYHDRVKLLAKLLGVDEKEISATESKAEQSAEKIDAVERMSNDTNRLEREGNAAQSKEDKKEKWTEALQMYQKLLKLDPSDEISASNYARLAAKYTKTFPNQPLPKTDDDQVLDNFDVDNAIENAKQGGVMHEKMKRQTIAEEITDLASKSEQYNANTSDSRRKNKHLGTEFDRELNEELLDHTGSEMVLDKEGKAQEIQNVDVKSIGKLDATQIHHLKQEVVTHRGNKAQNVHHIQLNSRESGQIVNAQTGRDQAEKAKTNLQAELADRAAAALKASGKKLTSKDIAALHEAAANDELYVKLHEAA